MMTGKKYIVTRLGEVLITDRSQTMKKTSVLITSLCALGAAVSMAAPVSSVNAVGYYTVTLPASNKFVMVGSSFDPVSGNTNVPRTVLDIFGAESGLRKSQNPARVDKVLVWDVSSQLYLVLGMKTNGLFYKWDAFSGGTTNPVVPLGYGLFIQSPIASNGGSNDTTITLAGQVPTVLTNVLSISGAVPIAPYQLICNPYPVSLPLNQLINTNHGAKGSSSPANCDRVFLWDVDVQKYITLGLRTPSNMWAVWDPWTPASYPNYNIEPGRGFWYVAKSNFTWKAEKAYNWP